LTKKSKKTPPDCVFFGAKSFFAAKSDKAQKETAQPTGRRPEWQQGSPPAISRQNGASEKAGQNK